MSNKVNYSEPSDTDKAGAKLAEKLTYYIVDLRKLVLYAKRSKEACEKIESPNAKIWEQREKQLEGVCKQLRQFLLTYNQNASDGE